MLSNSAHGPYGGGKNKQSLEEAARDLSENMQTAEFDSLVEQMAQDQQVEPGHESLPRSREDIPHLKAVKNLPTYVNSLQISNNVVAFSLFSFLPSGVEHQ